MPIIRLCDMDTLINKATFRGESRSCWGWTK